MKMKSIFPGLSKKEAAQPSATASSQHASLSDTKSKAGWFSPAYIQDRAVKLDPAAMEKNRLIAMFPESREIDFYKVLRTRILRRTKDQGGRTIMFTSALPGEGKTLTAINLSLTFAREFEQTALLVDCDLRKQSIHKMMGFKSDMGIVDHLLGNKPLSDLIVWPGIEKLTVISGSRTINESSEIIGSPKMLALVEDMKSRYPERYIFFDVPPVLAVADAIAFAPLVDWIVMVVQAGTTPLAEVNNALQVLPEEKLIGLILNRQTTRIPNYYYYYGREKESGT